MFYQILTDLPFIFGLSIVLNITMLFGILYLFKWRKSIDDKSIFVVSKDFEDTQLELKKRDSKIFKEYESSIRQLAEQISKNEEDFQRFKEGYDLKILNRFLDKFLRIYKIIEEDISFYKEEKNTEVVKCLENIKDIFEDFLLENGVEAFSPKAGESYKEAKGVCNNPERLETNSENENMKIAVVKNKGFKNISNGNNRILSPAIVSVYKYKKGA